MYGDRLGTLTRAYRNARKVNEAYETARVNCAKYSQELRYMEGLGAGLRALDAIIVAKEKDWQDAVVRRLEAEIMECLSYIYPSDGYNVTLNARVLRGKVRIEGSVRSYFADEISGDISDTQGRLFQQVVSFAALVAVMMILHVNTIYIDEAFSGAAKANISKVNKLLQHIQEKGINLIMIAQDTGIAQSIPANVLFFDRSADNKTTVTRRVV